MKEIKIATAEQKEIAEKIKSRKQTILIGEMGSGKTIIYYEACKDYKDVLYVGTAKTIQSLKVQYDVDWTLITYDSVKKLPLKKWGVIILDECHKIKNPKTTRYKRIKDLEFHKLIMGTGTPMDQVPDLYTYFLFTKHPMINQLDNHYYQKLLRKSKPDLSKNIGKITGFVLSEREYKFIYLFAKRLEVTTRKGKYGGRISVFKAIKFDKESKQIFLDLTKDIVIIHELDKSNFTIIEEEKIIKLSIEQRRQINQIFSEYIEWCRENKKPAKVNAIIRNKQAIEMLKVYSAICEIKAANIIKYIDLDIKQIIVSRSLPAKEIIKEQLRKNNIVFSCDDDNNEKDFKFNEENKVLLISSKSSEGGNHGIAESMIFVSLPYSSIGFRQLSGRLIRFDTEGVKTYTHLLTDHPLDRVVKDLVRGKSDIQKDIFGF